MKKINFNSIDVDFRIEHPKPASRFIPEWYKKLAGVVSGNETIKKCMPFLDAMTTGYMIVLASDVFYDGYGFQQTSKKPVITNHLKEQLGDFELPNNYSTQPYKWENFFIVKTPKGYSTLFTHPLNRIDLPFYSLSGVVDTDNFPVQVNFPFFVRKDFVGVIPAGTPIAQAIPFKRTQWKSKVEDKKRTTIPAFWLNNHLSPPFSLYKRKYWQKKKYN